VLDQARLFCIKSRSFCDSVDSVDKYYEQHQEKLHFIKTPCDIPPGRYAIYQDDSENLFRIIDLSRER
jgi:hypothetical protein